MIVRAGYLALPLVCGSALGADLGCRANPNLIGACYQDRGTLMPSADIGLVLSVPGVRPSVVVRAAPGSDRDLPAAIESLYTDVTRTTITGDFLACPIPEQRNQFERGFLKYVCVESGSDLTIHAWGK